MNREEAKKMLQDEKLCFEKSTSVHGCNHVCYACDFSYKGNIREHIEVLRVAIESIEILIKQESEETK